MPTRTAPTRAPQRGAGRTAPKTPVARPAVVAIKPRPNLFGPLSIVVGLAALGLGLVPLVGFFSWPLGIVGAVLGIVGATRLLRRHGASIAGIVIGALAVVIGLAVSVTGVQGFAVSAAGGQQPVAATVLGGLPTATASPLAAEAVATPSLKRILSDPSGSRYGGYPASERRFVRALATADAAFAKAPTGRWTTILSARDAAACRTLTKNAVVNWVGQVHDVGTDEDGNGWINIEVARTMAVQTWNNALSDGGQGTLVKRTSPFYKTLATVSQGSTVRFSGTLLGSSTSCLQQQNLTTRMYGLDPNFIVKLSALSLR